MAEIEKPDTPTNVVDFNNQAVIGQEYGSGKDITIPVDKDGNVILFRGTDNPNRVVNIDFQSQVGRGEVGYGKGNYYSPNPQYAANYAVPSGRNLYGFSTDIKPNEIINFQQPLSSNPKLAKALGVEEIYWNTSNPNYKSNVTWSNLFNEIDKEDVWNEAIGDYEVTKKSKYGRTWFQNNIDNFKNNGVKAFITTEVGEARFTRAEIFPLVSQNNNLNIKPIVQYNVEGAGVNLNQFKEIPIDTPTTVAGAEVIDEIEGIQRETIEKLRNANDAFVAEQIDDIMARKINEVLPFVDTSISRAEAIGISTTGPQITTSADPVLNTFIDDIENITGQNLDITEKRKLRQFMYDVATNNEYGLLNDTKSFSKDITVNASKLNDPGYKVWKNWQNSGAFREKNITSMTPNEFTAFGPPDYVYLVEGLEKSGENINFTAISDADVNIPEGLTDNWIDNYTKTTTSFVDNLPLSTTVKNQFNNIVQGRAKNLATPGGVADAVDVWELGVLGLMIAAVAYKEYDEIPTILTNKAVDMFNSMTSSYGIPPVPKEQYDLDYEFINKVVETGEKFMPTDIIIKKVGEVVKGAAETGAVTGFGYVPPNLTKTDTMETTQKIQLGVQEEKMFKQAKPKKVKSGGGSGVKIR